MAVPFSRESPFTKLSQEVAHCRPRPRTGNPWPMTDKEKKKAYSCLKGEPSSGSVFTPIALWGQMETPHPCWGLPCPASLTENTLP